MTRENVQAQSQPAIDDNNLIFRGFFENSGDAIQILDNNIFVECNQATVEILRAQSKDEVLSTHPSQLSPEFQPVGRPSGEKANEMIQTALEKGSHRFEWMHRRVDGEDFPVEVMLTPVTIGDKTILYSSWRDIADRKAAEAEAQEAQQWLESFLDNFPGGVWAKDTEGHFLLANRYTVVDIAAMTEEELIGKTVYDTLPKDTADFVWASEKRLLETGETISIEDEIPHADGEVRNKITTKFPLYDAEGKISGIGGILIDITDRKLAEQRLSESEERYRRMSEASVEGIVIHDKGILLDANELFAEMFGYEPSEVIGMPATEFLTLETRGITAENIRSGYEGSYEAMALRKDGSTFPVEITGKAIPYEGQTARVTALRDITERKRLEQEIQTALERRGSQVQISTEISQEIAEATELTELFDRVVDLTKERLGYYHTQLLRYDPAQDAVVLISGYGETGQQMAAQGHHMPMGSGLIGTAAETGEIVMRPDLAADPDWHANPLLPETRGEIAVPIKLGDEVLGVLDVQSDTTNALTDDDRLLLEGLCGQIAIAMQQTRLRQEMAERLDEINRLYRAMSREGWQEYQTTTSLPEGFQYDQADVRAIVGESEAPSLVTAPLTVPGGYSVGTLAIADDPENPLSEEDKAFLILVSEQVALALESARLSEQTQISLAETQSLYRFNEAITGQMDLEDIYQVVAQMACEELDFSGSWIGLYDPENHALQGVVGINMPEERIKASLHLEQMTPATLAAQTRQNVIVNDPAHDERMVDIPTDVRVAMGKALAIPILIGNEVGGAIAVTRPEDSADISEREARILQVVANQMAITMERARLFERTQTALEAVQESEAQLSEALEIAKLGYWEFDFANDEFILTDNFFAIYHTTAEKMGGYRMSSTDYSEKFVHPEDAPMVGEAIGSALANTDRFYSTQLEHRILYQDGGVGYIAVNVNLERDEKGDIIRWYGANQDITERRQAEEAVRQAQERAQTILETVTLPMIITRLSDNFLTFANQPAADLIGISIDELVDQPSPNFYYDPEARQEFIKELQEKGFVTNMQMQLMRNDGEPFWALISARVFSYLGETSILSSLLDITDRIEAQEATVKRAAELATVAEVGTTISTILEEQPLLETVVQQTQERFDLYHCHIFLADAKNQTLQVKACGWEEGSPHIGTHGDTIIHTDQEQSLVAQAARGQKAVIVNDVRSDPNWLPNELLPETRSEMAVPLIAGNQVLGVLDVQSDEVDRFTEEDISIMTTLASQVAVALQNSRTYAQTQQQAEHEAMINLISQRIQSTTSVENALQVAIRELGRALGAKRTNVQLGLSPQEKSGQ